MSELQRTLIDKLASTNLSADSKTKDAFNKIIYNAFHNCSTNLDETILVTLAYKYRLDCFDEIMAIIESEKNKLPF